MEKMNEIIIRASIETDRELMFQWSIDPELNQYDPKPLPKNEVERTKAKLMFHEYFINEVLTDGSGNYKYCMIADGDRLIGTINLFAYDEKKREMELGIMIGDRRYHGSGVAAEAVRQVLSRIEADRLLERVRVETNVENLRAVRLFERVGFVKESVEDWGDGVFFQIMIKELKGES